MADVPAFNLISSPSLPPPVLALSSSLYPLSFHIRTHSTTTGDCKIGALLSALVLGMCYVISMFHDYHVDTDQVGAVARKQIMDEVGYYSSTWGQDEGEERRGLRQGVA